MQYQGLPLNYPILCREGWRSLSQLQPGMEALSLNPKTFSFLYTKITDIIVFQNVPGLQIVDKLTKNTLLECSQGQLWWIAQEYANLRNMDTIPITTCQDQFLFTKIEWGFSSEKSIWVSECFFLDLDKFEIIETILPQVWYPVVDTGLWFTQFEKIELCITKNK